MPALMNSLSMATSGKQLAWHTPEESSMTFMYVRPLKQHKRHSTRSANCMESKPGFAVSHLTNDVGFDWNKPNRFLNWSAHG